jgi:putative membrane-bound dehydrogenase-like protein
MRSCLARVVFLLTSTLVVAPTVSWSAPGAPTPPQDWRLELISEAPVIRHPSVVCSAPDGRIFVAEDPMDIRVPADATHGRILCFRPNGEHTVFATNLYAVFGMQYLEGKLYALHNPKFSVFTDADGKAIDRFDLIESTHPKPWALDWNDHVPANFKLAMDGYFYVAVGDKGIYGAVGRDGQRVDLHGGGILRLHPDGTGLEVYCTGVRNILDVALNAEDEIFTYDNTDEHDWMGRLTHMVEAGFYGYPFDFVPRRPYTLWMMADFGAGAATGTFAYTEDALPAEYQNNLFLADFGKRQILRVRIEREGATYRVVKKEDMFRDPPEDFRPVGIALSADGASIYICDWAHRDTKEDVQVGRLWKMTYTGENHATAKPSWYVPLASGRKVDGANGSVSVAELIGGLSHGSKNVRLAAQRELVRRLRQSDAATILSGLRTVATNAAAAPYARWHALWALDAAEDPSALITSAGDPDPTVRRQALRILATSGSSAAQSTLQKGLADSSAPVRFAAATGLGSCGSSPDVALLLAKLDEPDPFSAYAIFTALNRIGRKHPFAWASIVDRLDDGNERVRERVGFALRNTYDTNLVSALERMVRDTSRAPVAREAALRALIDLHHQPAPWKGEWWAYHPALQAPPKKNTSWSGTKLITELLRQILSDRATSMRLLSMDGIGAATDEVGFASMAAQYDRDGDPAVRRAIIKNAGLVKSDVAFELLRRVISDSSQEPGLTRDAILAMVALERPEGAGCIADLLRRPGNDVKIAAVDALGNLKATRFANEVANELSSTNQALRVAVVRALAKIGDGIATATLRPLLAGEDTQIRIEAIRAMGSLRDTNSIPQLLSCWQQPETRETALEALARMTDIRALEAYLSGLGSANPAVRELCRKALTPIREEALPQIAEQLAHLDAAAVTELRRVYKDHPKANELFAAVAAPPTAQEYETFALRGAGDPLRGERLFFDENGLACSKCHSAGGKGKTVGPDLTSAGTQFSRAALVENVLYPSKAVREGYAQTIVETRDGETVSGLVQSETADTLSLIDTGGLVHKLGKETISRRSVSSFSLMPEGLQAGLTLEQFSDLIAYLESLKGAVTKP